MKIQRDLNTIANFTRVGASFGIGASIGSTTAFFNSHPDSRLTMVDIENAVKDVSYPTPLVAGILFRSILLTSATASAGFILGIGKAIYDEMHDTAQEQEESTVLSHSN